MRCLTLSRRGTPERLVLAECFKTPACIRTVPTFPVVRATPLSGRKTNASIGINVTAANCSTTGALNSRSSIFRPSNRLTNSRFYPFTFVPATPLSFHSQLRLVSGTFLDGRALRLGQWKSSDATETRIHGARLGPTSTPSEPSLYEVARRRERSIESPHHGC